MINYSQKIAHRSWIHGIQKIVLNIHKKLSECLLFLKILTSTRVLVLGLWVLVLDSSTKYSYSTPALIIKSNTQTLTLLKYKFTKSM